MWSTCQTTLTLMPPVIIIFWHDFHNYSFISYQNLLCDHSLESSRREDSNEWSHDKFAITMIEKLFWIYCIKWQKQWWVFFQVISLYAVRLQPTAGNNPGDNLPVKGARRQKPRAAMDDGLPWLGYILFAKTYHNSKIT